MPYVLLTPNDLNLNLKYPGLPITVIAEGRMKHKNLTLLNETEEWLYSELEREGHYKLNDIFYAYVKGEHHSLTIVPYK